MRPGDLVRLVGVSEFYVCIDENRDQCDQKGDFFGILLRKRTEEFTEEDVDNLGFGSHVWDVLVSGRVEKVWEIDLAVINNSFEGSNILDLSKEKKDKNLRHLNRVMRILKDGRFK